MSNRPSVEDAAREIIRIAARDLGVRCIYIACVFSMFSGIERLALAYWPWRSWRTCS